MKTHTLIRQQVVPAPLERVFGFFSQPENLSKLTPTDLGFVILTPSPIEMKPGTLIDYTIRLLGFRVRWTMLITAFEPGPTRGTCARARGEETAGIHIRFPGEGRR